jgi:hypothetical protein
VNRSRHELHRIDSIDLISASTSSLHHQLVDTYASDNNNGECSGHDIASFRKTYGTSAGWKIYAMIKRPRHQQDSNLRPQRGIDISKFESIAVTA